MNPLTTVPLTISYDAIMQQLLTFNLQTREQHRHLAGQSSVPAHVWASDHCSVSAGAGRQNGKTSWILRNFTRSDILVVTNLTFKKALCEQIIDTVKHARIFTAQEVQAARDQEQCAPFFDRCFVDEPMHVFERVNRRQFYKWACPNDDQVEHTFFLMG